MSTDVRVAGPFGDLRACFGWPTSELARQASVAGNVAPGRPGGGQRPRGDGFRLQGDRLELSGAFGVPGTRALGGPDGLQECCCPGQTMPGGKPGPVTGPIPLPDVPFPGTVPLPEESPEEAVEPGAIPVPAPSPSPSPAAGEELPGGPDVNRWRAEIEAAAQETGVPAKLIAAVMKQESGGDPDAVSPAGAQGLLQLMPGTAKELGVEDPFNPAENIRGGARYLKQQLETFGGDVTKALAAYNAGPGAVQEHGGVPPYAETQQYVKTITETLDT